VFAWDAAPQLTPDTITITVLNGNGGDGSTGGGGKWTCKTNPDHPKCQPPSSQADPDPAGTDARDGRPTFSRAFEPIPPE
jgi:hypothetical protein